MNYNIIFLIFCAYLLLANGFRNFNKIKNTRIIKINKYEFFDNKKYSLLKKYINFAIFTSIKFKNKYNLKLQNNEELYMYAKIGLYKAIVNYNFNDESKFIYYAHKYIHGELINYISDMHPISVYSKCQRKNKYKNLIKNNKIIISLHNNVYINKIKLSNNYSDAQKTYELWKMIYSNLDNNSFNIFKHKYDYNFNVLRSNLNISQIFGYSEEYIRLNINKSKNIIKCLLEER